MPLRNLLAEVLTSGVDLKIRLGEPSGAAGSRSAREEHDRPHGMISLLDSIDVPEVRLRVERDSLWEEPLQALRIDEPLSCVVDGLAVPPVVHTEVRGVRVRGGAALVASVLRSIPRGSDLALLVSRDFLVGTVARPVRQALRHETQLALMIFIRGRDLSPELHSAVELALLVARNVSDEHAVINPQRAEMTRLIDLRGVTAAEWLTHVRQTPRGAEAMTRQIVLNRGLPDDGPWTFERFSPHEAAALEDLSRIGQVRSLGDVAEIRIGMHVGLQRERVRESETSECPEGSVPIYVGRDVEPGHGLAAPTRFIESTALNESQRLQPDDVLIRRICSRRTPGIGPVVVSQTNLPAAFADSVVRLRWRPEVPVHVYALLVAYLDSARFRALLAARSTSMHDMLHITPAILAQTPVPWPSRDVLEALSGLERAEQTYLGWAERVRRVRQSIFGADSYRDVIPTLLEGERVERERVQAGREAETFEYTVRQYFPHAIAMRFEQVRRATLPAERLDAALQCAEHLVRYLAFVAMLSTRAEAQRFVPPRLKDWGKRDRASLDWGSCRSIVEESVARLHDHPNPLVLPVPELVPFAAQLRSERNPWVEAEAALRAMRNAHSHLERLRPDEHAQRAQDAIGHLEALLRATSFLTATPLVHVTDYHLNSINRERRADFEFLVGASPVHRMVSSIVDVEVPRGELGVQDRSGVFHSLLPWLVYRECRSCGRKETFAFNSIDGETARFVAMETGHPYEDRELAAAFRRLLG